MKGFGMPKPLKSIEKQTLFLILGHSKKTMKNQCQNNTQKIMKLTKNATKIYEKVEGRRGKGRKGKGKERNREDRRGEGRKGEERKPPGRGDGAASIGGRFNQP
jgi:hypothetical protein